MIWIILLLIIAVVTVMSVSMSKTTRAKDVVYTYPEELYFDGDYKTLTLIGYGTIDIPLPKVEELILEDTFIKAGKTPEITMTASKAKPIDFRNIGKVTLKGTYGDIHIYDCNNLTMEGVVCKSLGLVGCSTTITEGLECSGFFTLGGSISISGDISAEEDFTIWELIRFTTDGDIEARNITILYCGEVYLDPYNPGASGGGLYAIEDININGCEDVIVARDIISGEGSIYINNNNNKVNVRGELKVVGGTDNEIHISKNRNDVSIDGTITAAYVTIYGNEDIISGSIVAEGNSGYVEIYDNDYIEVQSIIAEGDGGYIEIYDNGNTWVQSLIASGNGGYVDIYGNYGYVNIIGDGVIMGLDIHIENNRSAVYITGNINASRDLYITGNKFVGITGNINADDHLEIARNLWGMDINGNITCGNILVEKNNYLGNNSNFSTLSIEGTLTASNLIEIRENIGMIYISQGLSSENGNIYFNHNVNTIGSVDTNIEIKGTISGGDIIFSNGYGSLKIGTELEPATVTSTGDFTVDKIQGNVHIYADTTATNSVNFTNNLAQNTQVLFVGELNTAVLNISANSDYSVTNNGGSVTNLNQDGSGYVFLDP